MYKLIATDLDGTFLSSPHGFDANRFWRVFDRMQAAGCRFVLASGDQFYCMKQYFGARWQEMDYVAENGAWVLAGGTTELYSGAIAPQQWQPMMRAMVSWPGALPVLCGKASAYVPTAIPQDVFEQLEKYMPHLVRTDDFDAVEDQIFKLCAVVPPQQVQACKQQLQAHLPEGLSITASGSGYMDVIPAGQHKASGLALLLRRYGIHPEDCAAFGDEENDVELLAFVGDSYAMGNAVPAVKQVAKHTIAPNTQSAVLQKLEEWFPA